MRRPAKGGTTHPTQPRPGMGFGRPLRPPRGRVVRADLLAEVQAFLRGEPAQPGADVDSSIHGDNRAPVTGDLR